MRKFFKPLAGTSVSTVGLATGKELAHLKEIVVTEDTYVLFDNLNALAFKELVVNTYLESLTAQRQEI